ncbi:MAG: RHS repeat-associated core domain-containing protein, partial [Caulobacter sp.]
YDAMRRVVMKIGPDPDGTGPRKRRAEAYAYDAEGRLIQTDIGTTSSSSGADFTTLERVTVTYDAAGQKVQQRTMAADLTTPITLTEFTYDGAGRHVCTAVRMNPALFTAAPGYACLSQGAEGSYGRDRIDYSVLDAAGQLVIQVKANDTPLAQLYARYSYTANGKQASVTDVNGNKTTMTYDGFDRLVQQNFPSTTRGSETSSAIDYEQYGYDANGNRVGWRKRDGSIIDYGYDALNRMAAKSGANVPAVAYAYDLAGRPTAVLLGASGTGVVYGYDTAGRRTSETTFGRALSFQYDKAGLRTRVTWPDGFYAGYVYDAAGQLKAVNDNGATSGAGLLQTFVYDDLGRRTDSTRGNGTLSAYQWDSANRLTLFAHALVDTTNSLTQSFAYNPAGQVTARGSSNANYRWTPSSASEAYTADGLNRDAAIAALGACAPTGAGYDCNGNLTNDGARTFAYDGENRLVSVSGSPSTALSYDPAGRLSGATTTAVGAATVTSFLYDGDKLVAEYDGAGVLLRRYVHGIGVDEPLVTIDAAGTRSWLYADRQGSIIAVGDAAGAAQPLVYGPYGEPSSWAGGRFRYTGQIALPEARLYHYKARVYDPARGWFLQTDPIGYKDDLNLYAYVGGDPLNQSDPTGAVGSRVGGQGSSGGFEGEIDADELERARNRGVDRRWAMERKLVASGQPGTVNWTAAQKAELLKHGRVKDYVGHHINTVKGNPLSMAENPYNVKLITKSAHIKLHLENGGFRVPITGQPLMTRGIAAMNVILMGTGILSGRIRTDNWHHMLFDTLGFPDPHDGPSDAYLREQYERCKSMGIQSAPGEMCA